MDENIKEIIPKVAKISLHKQKSGRGGHPVTVITISGNISPNPEKLLKELKKSLGCGGQIEEGKPVLHGDISKRLFDLLLKWGAKKVILP